ncbi:uncharacterized protein LOC143187083 isoform X2 [Calliopsis andreniformis]|uniref:uncharacterized protein LOC143187083 isoform X2 n=1 Tax=Calliopsis andreniformis TaxID=337506 RepID=UPI003FCEBDF0
MSRSVKDSDEEFEVKAGRRTRSLAGSLALDSPLRRSTRIKPAVKQNESSPESPLSDASSVSNTQLRATRRRTATMDNTTAAEKSRTLRSRRNSVASDMSEATEAELLSTPTKKTKGSAASDLLSKASNRTSKRFTRAGSEAKSPPTSKPKTTRRTRASSAEPENMEVKGTPTRVRRRTSMLPSEATVLEEKEERMRIPVVALDRTLPNLAEVNETVSEDKLGKSYNIDEKNTEDTICVKEAHNNAADKPPSNTFEDVKTNVPVDDEKIVPTINQNVENTENSVDSVMKTESAAGNTSQLVVTHANQDASKELGLKIENLLNDSLKEQNEDVNNKENQEVNIISDLQGREDTASSVLQSPKPLSLNNVIATKSTKESCKSINETNLTIKRRHSKELLEIADNNDTTKECTNDNDAANNSTTKINTSIHEDDGDSSDTMQKLTISTDTESLTGTPHNESSDKNGSPIEMSSSSSLDSSIKIVECTENINKVDSHESSNIVDKEKESIEETRLEDESNIDINVKTDVPTSELNKTTDEHENTEENNTNKIDNKEKESIQESDLDDECNEDLNMKLDVSPSHIEETTDECKNSEEDISKTDNKENESVQESSLDNECNEDSNVKMDVSTSHIKETTDEHENVEQDNTSKNTSTKDEHETIEEKEKIDAIKQKTDICSESLNASLDTNNKSSAVLEDETTVDNLAGLEKTNNLSTSDSTIRQSLEKACTSSETSTSINKNEDDVSDPVKLTQSSAVTETPVEASEEVPEKELSEKTSTLDNSSSLEKQIVDKAQSRNEQEKSEENEEECKKNQEENMEVDDNDSDTNTENLFQDIPADEWKEKNTDIDKDSLHSMSTERLENESETDCDLVLVDREAWLAAENIKAEKEKDVFDYDSDDTVLMKSRRDSLKAQQEEKLMNSFRDESKMNTSKNKTLNTSSKRKSIQQKEIEDKEVAEDVEDVDVEENAVQAVEDTKDVAESVKGTDYSSDDENAEEKDIKNVSKRKSMTKETNDQSVVEKETLSTSRKSIKIQENLNKSSANSSLNKSNLCGDISKKRKSLNKSVQNVNEELEKSNRTESAKKRKSLNKSKLEENETGVKENAENQSSNRSSKKRIKPKQLDANVNQISDSETEIFKDDKKKNSSIKKTFQSLTVEGSDSDVNRSNVDSEDSQGESVTLPKFLFGRVSDSDTDNENESSQSIDSDIANEYNLSGKDTFQFSDDDVPGDDCRASETESSDPEDDGADLIDFVVDDDEVEEEEESEEEEGDGIEQEECEEEKKDLEIEEDESEEEKEEIENGKDKNVEESENDEDKEAAEEQDEEMQVEQEVDDVEEEIEEKMTEKEENLEEEEHVQKANKSLDTSNKKRKSRNSINSKPDASLTDKGEKEHNVSNISLSSSLKMKKLKQKRMSNEVTDDIEQSLNKSPMILNKKLQKLNKSMECSTPKVNSKQKRFSITLNALDVTDDIIDDTRSQKKKVDDTTLKMENSSKKLKKIKDKENLMHRSLPSELIQLVEKTNVSKPISSKITNLNKTTVTPYSESPTVKHLRKDKLNDTAPELKLSDNFKKLMNNSTIIQKENIDEEGSNSEATEKVNKSLEKKLLKVADNILKTDDQKKRKRRKKSKVDKTTPVQFIEDNLEENTDSSITKTKQNRSNSTGTPDGNDEQEEIPVDKKKRKKKKKMQVEVTESVQEESHENVIETKTENNDEMYNEVKKKKKKGKKLEHDDEIQISMKKKAKKEKKDGKPQELSTEKLPKKKQKLSKEVLLQNEEMSIETVPKKKQKLLKDAAFQDTTSIETLPKKKKKLSKAVDVANKEDSPKKLSKKKQKLSAENVSKSKEKSAPVTDTLQRSSNVVSDSDEGPEIVAFSKARDEALEMVKRASDSVKASKEIKKKKQQEHVERMLKEKEIKIQKLESKNLAKKSNKSEVEKRSIKRLPDEILENLSDVPSNPRKKRKLSKSDDQIIPSRSMFDLKTKGTKTVRVEDDFNSLSSYGSTTQFDIVNLQKIKKKRKVPEIASFRQKMLARNSRQPVSAYLMYLEKQKASGCCNFTKAED